MVVPGPESASRKILAVEAKSTNPGPHGRENWLAGASGAQMPPNFLNLGTSLKKSEQNQTARPDANLTLD